jgi:hypothetical protein
MYTMTVHFALSGDAAKAVPVGDTASTNTVRIVRMKLTLRMSSPLAKGLWEDSQSTVMAALFYYPSVKEFSIKKVRIQAFL